MALEEYNHPNGNIFISQESGRLVVTCDNMPAQFHAEVHYTVQMVLFFDGRFTFSYNGLPDLKFYVDDRPDTTAWAIGIKPALAPPGTANFTNLPKIGRAHV